MTTESNAESSNESTPVLLDVPSQNMIVAPSTLESNPTPEIEAEGEFLRALIIAPTGERLKFEQYIRLGMKFEALCSSISVSIACQSKFMNSVLSNELSHIPLPKCDLSFLEQIYNPLFPASVSQVNDIQNITQSVTSFLNPGFSKWNMVFLTPQSLPIALPGIIHFQIPFILISNYPIRPSNLGSQIFGAPSSISIINSSKFKLFEASQLKLLKPILSPFFTRLQSSVNILNDGIYQFIFDLNIPILNIFPQYLLHKPKIWPSTDITLGYFFFGEELLHSESQKTISFSPKSSDAALEQISNWLQQSHNVVLFHVWEYFNFLITLNKPSQSPLKFLSQLIDTVERLGFRALIFTGAYVLPPEDTFKTVLKRATIDLSSKIKYVSGNGFQGAPLLSWLLPQCRAAVLIPEPFSTNESISAGLPIQSFTFNNTSSFWAHHIHQANFGPPPLSLNYCTVDDICDSMRLLLGADMKKWKFFSLHAGKYIHTKVPNHQSKILKKIISLMKSGWTWNTEENIPSSTSSSEKVEQPRQNPLLVSDEVIPDSEEQGSEILSQAESEFESKD